MQDSGCPNMVIGFSENEIFFFHLLHILCDVERINGHHFFLGEAQLAITKSGVFWDDDRPLGCCGLQWEMRMSYFGQTLLCGELAHWKRLWCWERLKGGGEGDNRGGNCWMAFPTWWTWVEAGYWRWCWTGSSGMLQSIGSQSWTRLSDWTELSHC